MKVTTKGRYALRIMLDLSMRSPDSYTSLKDIADRQDISMKYLETIVSVLNKAGFVQSQRGKSGGYKLSRLPEEYTIGSVLKLTEGNLAPVSCVENGKTECVKSGECLTLPMWIKLDSIIDDYLEHVTLKDLIDKKI